MSARETLALTIRYLVGHPGSTENQLLWNQREGTLYRYTRFGLRCLLKALRRIPDAAVEMPSLARMRVLSDAVKTRCGGDQRLVGVFGFIDVCMHKSQRPGTQEEQDKYYNGYYGVNGYKGVYLMGADGCILWADLVTGIHHDNSVYHALSVWLHDNVPVSSGFKILRDSAFAVSDHMIRPYTKREQGRFCDDPARLSDVRDHNKALCSIRIAAEWGMQYLLFVSYLGLMFFPCHRCVKSISFFF